MKNLFKFLRPGIIFNIPTGQQGVDAAGANGLIGLMSNANAYADQMSSTATAGTNVNITAAAVASGVIQLNTGAAALFTATLPSTASILGALGNAIAQDGSFSKIIYIINNLTTFSGVLTAGDANTTIVGTATIGSNFTRTMMLRVLNSSNITISNMGAMIV